MHPDWKQATEDIQNDMDIRQVLDRLEIQHRSVPDAEAARFTGSLALTVVVGFAGFGGYALGVQRPILFAALATLVLFLFGVHSRIMNTAWMAGYSHATLESLQRSYEFMQVFATEEESDDGSQG